MRIAEDDREQLSPLRLAMLLRIACAGGATRADIVKDLAPLVSHKLSPAQWREAADAEMSALASTGFLIERKQRIEITEAGRSTALSPFAPRAAMPVQWAEMRDTRLVALALGLASESAAKLKALSRPELLRAAILRAAFDLPARVRPTPAALRAALAVVALERAFGNKIKSGLGSGSGLPAKAGRLLAGQLSTRPRDFGTDGRLIAALAAEAAGAVQTDAEALRTAVLRRWLASAVESGQKAGHRPVAVAAAPHEPAAAQPIQPANDRGLAPIPPAQQQRPDLSAFAAAVIAAARPRAEGWPGNRKTFISLVWQSIRGSQSGWGISEIEFKCMLAEAHKAGLVVLANADIKDKSRMKELQDSAVAYKNTVWHFVRVED